MKDENDKPKAPLNATDEECTCDEYRYDYHPCPYDEEINNNLNSSCNCCPCCTRECLMDI